MNQCRSQHVEELADLAVVDAEAIGAGVGVEIAGVERQHREDQERQQDRIGQERRALLHVEDDERDRRPGDEQQTPTRQQQRLAVGKDALQTREQVVAKRANGGEEVDGRHLPVLYAVGGIEVKVVIPEHRADRLRDRDGEQEREHAEGDDKQEQW
ncbi:hypothetical protein D9M68_465020 [compost metagenome]